MQTSWFQRNFTVSLCAPLTAIQNSIGDEKNTDGQYQKNTTGKGGLYSV